MDKFRIGTPQCGLLFAALGAVLALMLLYMGFWRTLFVIALAAVGYFIGASEDKAESLKALINKVFPPKSE